MFSTSQAFLYIDDIDCPLFALNIERLAQAQTQKKKPKEEALGKSVNLVYTPHHKLLGHFQGN